MTCHTPGWQQRGLVKNAPFLDSSWTVAQLCVYEWSPWAEPPTGLLLVVNPGFLLHQFPSLPAMLWLFGPVDLCPPPSWRHTILTTHWAPGTASAPGATSAEPHLSAWVTTSRRTQGPSRHKSLSLPSPRSSTTLYLPQFQTMCFASSDQSQSYGVGPGHSQQQWRYHCPCYVLLMGSPFSLPSISVLVMGGGNCLSHYQSETYIQINADITKDQQRFKISESLAHSEGCTLQLNHVKNSLSFLDQTNCRGFHVPVQMDSRRFHLPDGVQNILWSPMIQTTSMSASCPHTLTFNGSLHWFRLSVPQNRKQKSQLNNKKERMKTLTAGAGVSRILGIPSEPPNMPKVLFPK